MALRFPLIFSVVLVLSACGREMRNSPSTLHWLRSLDPGTDCAAQGLPGVLVADPENCMNYYVCDVNQDPIGPIPCSDGMRCFKPGDPDPTDGACSDDPNLCDGCTIIGPQCHKTCIKPMDQIYNPDDCSEHSICLEDGDTFEAYCPTARPYFNGKKCIDDKAQCCNCRVPTCETGDGGKLFADPQDCHSYYLCAHSGPVHLTCEDGGSFVNHNCNPDNKDCTNICELGEVTTTTSSISSTPTPGCTDLTDFTCSANGFYAHCHFCDPSYFSCNENEAKIEYCPGELVFNPSPQFPYCIRPANCPYIP